MKKRIGTLLYDTNTAKELAKYVSPYGVRDNRHYIEWLYKKRTGEYFLYGEGNAGSCYSESVPGEEPSTRQAGANIIPLTFEKAQKWFEEANNVDNDLATDETYEAEFGTIKADKSEKEQQIFRLSKIAIQKVNRMAQIQHKTKSEIIENLIMSE